MLLVFGISRRCLVCGWRDDQRARRRETIARVTTGGSRSLARRRMLSEAQRLIVRTPKAASTALALHPHLQGNGRISRVSTHPAGLGDRRSSHSISIVAGRFG